MENYIKWIELLTENKKENYRELQETLTNNISVQLTIMEYRRLEMDKGRGQNITVKDLQEANNIELKEMLQKLFLEPIPQEHFNYFNELAIKRGYKDMKDALAELYYRHKKELYTRFMSIALTI